MVLPSRPVTRLKTFLAPVAVLIALALSLGLVACGGGDDDPPAGTTGTSTGDASTSGRVGDLPDGIVARVGDSNITEAEFERMLQQQLAGSAASGQAAPEEGTPAYDSLRRNVMRQLVLQRVVDFEARKCGRPCRVTADDIKAELGRIVQSNFNGSQEEFDNFLTEQKLTQDDANTLVRFQLQQPKLFSFVTRKVRFTAADARRFYTANTAQFTQPAGRTARHILVKTKAEADRVRARITDATFAAIARTASIDTGSAQQGGDLGQIQQGTLVPEFERVAFALKDGEISQPVKTQFGWHIIQVQLVEARVTPFAEARAGIISSQLGQRRQAEFDKFQTRVLAEWGRRTVYADASLSPASEPTATAPGATAPVETVTAPTGTTPAGTTPAETAPTGTSPAETGTAPATTP
jgi:hypothetical protein